MIATKTEAKGANNNVVPVATKLKPKQVCILGTAESLKEAPYDDPEWDMWAVATVIGHPYCKRMDRILELHGRDSWGPRIDECSASVTAGEPALCRGFMCSPDC